MFYQANCVPRLPPRTLALTFDDGPGPRTPELAQYLKDEGIQATFFVVGKHASCRPQDIAFTRSCGHLIGNHTGTHPSLTQVVYEQGRVASEVLGLERLLRSEEPQASQRFFRAPFGHYNPQVAAILNSEPELAHYCGPVGWDVDARDFWIGVFRENKILTPQACADAYLQLIQEKQSGIVLLHDWSANEGDVGQLLRQHNSVMDLVHLLIPKIKGNFQFVRLDDAKATWPEP